MKIILLRHGKPDIPDLGKLRASEFQLWIQAYNAAPLNIKSRPSKELIEIASRCNSIVCSNLRRSIDSARLLGEKDIQCIDAIFREFELPYSSFPSPKLSPGVWSVLHRVLWFMGQASHCESLSTAKQRVTSAANILHNKAVSHNTVLFVGHSLLNSFIAKKLIAKGWHGSISIFSKHWEFSVYEYLES